MRRGIGFGGSVEMEVLMVLSR